jgi:tetratricopeptide (TPR) repeat protein
MASLRSTGIALLALAAPAAWGDATAPTGSDDPARIGALLDCPRPPTPGRTVEDLERLVASAPDHADALYDLGLLLERAGRLEEARARFLELIKRYPKNPLIPDAYLVFADLCERRADTEQALRLFARVVETFPRARCADYARYRYRRLALQLLR